MSEDVLSTSALKCTLSEVRAVSKLQTPSSQLGQIRKVLLHYTNSVHNL